MSNNWIFLRGLTRGNIHWGDFPELFRAANPSANVEYLEIPGNGTLAHECTPTNPEVLIHLLKKNSKIVASNSPYQLCGISLGGMVALKWAELNSSKVKSVYVINSSLTQFSPFYKRLMIQNYFSLFKILLSSNSFNQEKTILQMTSNKFEENKKYLASYAEFSNSYKFKRVNFIRQLLLAKNIRIDKKILAKVIVLSAKQDRLVSSSCSIKMSKALEAQTHQHLTAGHDLPLDDSRWLIEKLMMS